MNRKLRVVLVLTVFLAILVVSPTEATDTMTYDGVARTAAYYQRGFTGDWPEDPTPGTPNAALNWAYLSACPATVTATIDGDQITVTVTALASGGGYVPPIPCYDPVFNALTPLTFTGHLATGDGDRIRGVEFPLVPQPDGSMDTMVKRFEAMTGCVVTDRDFHTIRGYWNTGVEGGLVVYWNAQCDEVFGIPAPQTTLQWTWGFLGYAP